MFQQLIDWSEVWAVLIPLAVAACCIIPARAKPLLWYCMIALLLNFSEDIIWKMQIVHPLSKTPGDNQFIYNIHSVVRFIFFSLFFIRLRQQFLWQLQWLFFIIFLLTAALNFIFWEQPAVISSRIMGLEAGLLALYCILYFFNRLLDEKSGDTRPPEYVLTVGICVFMIINFPLFLFYKPLALRFRDFAVDIWTVHNITYLLLCIIIARYFYAARIKRY
jgi:hypothetical protein